VKYNLGTILLLCLVLFACGLEKSPVDSRPAFYSESFHSGCKDGFGKIAATAQGGKVIIGSSEETIKIEHVDAYYNCCARITMEVKRVGSRFDVFEKDEGDSCDCMCHTDITVFICSLSAGVYLVRVFDITGNLIGQKEVKIIAEDQDFPR
jgi:hypothetical protein